MDTSDIILSSEKVAEKLIRLYREGKNLLALDELYADSIVRIEQQGLNAEKTEGKLAVASKILKWFSLIEKIHDITCSEPLIIGNHFSFIIERDITLKGQGRINWNEVCVHEVKAGKIVSEQFVLTAP